MFLDTLHRFEGCSLEQLEAFQFNTRTDTKYVFHISEVNALLNSLSSDYKVLEVKGDRSFHYRNTYYDTADFSHYIAHHNGIGNRVKYRTRQYGEDGPLYFEIKSKSNKGITQKVREEYPVGSRLLEVLPTGLTALGLPDQIETTQIAYQRITLLNEETHQKLTIDFNLEAFNDHKRANFNDLAVAEVKELKSSQTSGAMKFFKLNRNRSVRFSKYCVGLALLHDSLKKNRFKPVIRKIEKISNYTITTHHVEYSI